MFTICALYKFSTLDDFDKMQRPLRDFMDSLNVRGTLLLAREGINGTISGSDSAINKILDYLNADKRLSNLEYKFSYSETVPFKRLKVKLKKEIVTLGITDVDPTYSVGTYVKARDWNELIIDPEVVLIDTRNNYEFEIGSFKGAINPNTETFRQFPSYTKNNLEQYRNKKIAMFCTGGIRCEKSTAYLKSEGFENVYHLQGGILKYLEEVEEEENTHFYTVLECPIGASQDALKKSYKELIKVYHPDKVYNEQPHMIEHYTQKFQLLQKAYKALKAG